MHDALRELLYDQRFTSAVLLFFVSVFCMAQLATFWGERDAGWWANFILNVALMMFAILYLAIKSIQL